MIQISKKLVSVIVPVYNCEKFLSICIESILRQTYTTLELVLIDDGSLDKSGALCDWYAEKDNRIKVIHQENKGVSETRKAGVDISTGEYIIFIDSDDYIEHDYVENLFNKAEILNADIVCCNCIDEGIIGQPNICIESESIVSKKEEMFKLYFKGYRFAYVLWGKIYKRNIIENIDFVKLRFTEDTHMMINSFMLAETMVLIPYTGYHYRAQEGSVMASSKLVDIYRDTLVTTEYLLQICSHLNEELYLHAKQRMCDVIYGAVLEECKVAKQKNKIFYEQKKFLHYYNLIIGKGVVTKKRALIFLYKYLPKMSSLIIRQLYKIKNI